MVQREDDIDLFSDLERRIKNRPLDATSLAHSKCQGTAVHGCTTARTETAKLSKGAGVMELSKEELERRRLEAVGYEWELRRGGGVRRAHYRHVRRPLLQHGQRLQPQAVFRKKTKMRRLLSYPNQENT